jgi:hypothetical protein
MEFEEVSSPVQFATAVALTIAQAMFLFALSYWFGFSAVSGINVLWHFSLIEIFTSVADRRLGIPLILFLTLSASTAFAMGERHRRLRFIDDPSIKVPPPGVTPSDTPDGGQFERYMTSEELAYSKQWARAQRHIRSLAFVVLVAAVVSVVWLWIDERPALALRLSLLVVMATGSLLATSNSLAFIVLPLRSLLGSMLLMCWVSANMRSMDATNLIATGDSPNFPSVALVFDGHVVLGRLIVQTSMATLLLDPLRRYTSLSNSKVSEMRYLPQ